MEDWVLAASMTDGKGDRSKKPKEQSDSDLFLRIIAKSEKGIVVRGAKVHQGRPMAVDWMLVLPGTGLGPDEADHAVVFAVRPDTPGLSMVMSQGPAELFRMQADQEDLGNPQYGLHIGNLLIFNEVFIPWEHVFLCGEYQYVGELVDIFCRYHRMATGGCKAGLCDLIATLGAMIAEMNGLAKASHIKDKLIDIIKLGETSYGCAIAAATLGEKTSDGNFIPNAMQANITKLNAADAVNRSLALLQDIAGALVATLPSQKDLDSPTNGAFIRKYLASDGIGCEEKFKIFRLAQNLIFGAQGLVALHGGGSPQVQRMAVLFEANLQKKRTRARALAGINDTKGV
jgi:4-hydroxybutyryl-CoA dehydratase/vinylacetyl-CoA-Delta-isomerase